MLERLSKGCYIYTLEGTEYGLFRFRCSWKVFKESKGYSYYLGDASSLESALELINEELK